MNIKIKSEYLLPADKGGLRSADVSMKVCLSVCCSFEFTLNFTMVMGSFTGMYVLIVIDQ